MSICMASSILGRWALSSSALRNLPITMSKHEGVLSGGRTGPERCCVVHKFSAPYCAFTGHYIGYIMEFARLLVTKGGVVCNGDQQRKIGVSEF